MDIQDFVTDERTEVEGAWLEVDSKTSLKIARLGSQRFQDAYDKRMKPYAHLQRLNALPSDTTERVITDLMAELIVLDWKGLEENGAEIPFSKENARRVLQNRNFRSFVAALSADIQNFRAQQLEGDVKNS